MTMIEWADYCQDLADYFGMTRTFSERRIELWYRMVHWVPAEALDWIRDKIMEKQDSMPRNVPKATRFWWGQWLDANPNRRAREEKIQCDAPGCLNGYLFLVKPVEREGFPPYEAIAFCDRCAATRRLCAGDHPALGNLKGFLDKGFTLPAGMYAERAMKKLVPIDEMVGRVAGSFDM